MRIAEEESVFVYENGDIRVFKMKHPPKVNKTNVIILIAYFLSGVAIASVIALGYLETAFRVMGWR